MSNKTIVDMLSQAIFRLGKRDLAGALERVREAERWLTKMMEEKNAKTAGTKTAALPL